MTPEQLKSQIGKTAFAFRGYNVTNLGRTNELLLDPDYGLIVKQTLDEASEYFYEIMGVKIDLVARVSRGEETSLDHYAEAVALIMAVELAQLKILKTIFKIDLTESQYFFGYSLGEITTLVAADVFSWKEALKIPLTLAQDSVELSGDVTLGILFSRKEVLPFEDVQKACLKVNQQGDGVVGPSAILSPNTILVMGQGEALDLLKVELDQVLDYRIHLKKNKEKWPPLHTPIIWQRNIPCRASYLMHTLAGGLREPSVPILSLVTGRVSYTEINARKLLADWTDHPQLLWEVIEQLCSQGTERVVHIGPAPNIIPATLRRISENVKQQSESSLGMRALTSIAQQRWLAGYLPGHVSLLRAPLIEQVVLEDWLLDQKK